MKSMYCAALALTLGAISTQLQAQQNPFSIAIHGGAGTISKAKLTPAQIAQYEAKLAEAVNAGYAVLEQGGSSLDAVSKAVTILEASPLFNAGVGAVYTYDGAHELDAAIMDGKTLNAGAVASVRHVKSPIQLARLVMEESPHVMLAGAGVEEFAIAQQLPLVTNDHFSTDSRYQSLLKAKEKLRKNQKHSHQAAVEALPLDYKYGTVGAVALDKSGNLAAATSTGGMTAKRYGRVGDAPIIGAGTYAENGVCAISATGHGEYFIRYQVASDICARAKYQQQPLAKTADVVINQVLVEAGGSGGVIAVDAQGNVSMPFNSEGMYRASRKSGEAAVVAIWK
ncbi:isoaspartyl peptidase/L-asparaginase [Paraferrimonas sedimenticola]|uniref:Isoaspartyl peptidase n=2 Tax=Paraferrimonas sedimenticola TaxID=375674 RepID=A0AA37RWC8_9GAMM|nr:isoaspartyl peptidase/L-asparaginase [Paraferrimonas sedimenticola]GLP96466.1 isoaspartyl peptidase/L-asparaginase [Paraferrimonas sedimenticola]